MPFLPKVSFLSDSASASVHSHMKTMAVDAFRVSLSSAVSSSSQRFGHDDGDALGDVFILGWSHSRPFLSHIEGHPHLIRFHVHIFLHPFVIVIFVPSSRFLYGLSSRKGAVKKIIETETKRGRSHKKKGCRLSKEKRPHAHVKGHPSVAFSVRPCTT